MTGSQFFLLGTLFSFPYWSKRKFGQRRHKWPGMLGRLAKQGFIILWFAVLTAKTYFISHDGSVYICRMMRNNNFGNIHNNLLHDIITKKEVQELWRLTLDKISPCKDCSHRYACNECRAFESILSGNEFSVAICGRDDVEYAG